MEHSTIVSPEVSILYKKERKHLLWVMFFNVAVIAISTILVIIFAALGFGWFTYFFPIFWLTFSFVKFIKDINLYQNLMKAGKGKNKNTLNYQIFFKWTKKLIGNNYITTYLLIWNVFFYIIFLSIAYVTPKSVVNSDYVLAFSLIWIITIILVGIVWNINNVIITNYLDKSEYYVKTHATFITELKTNKKQAKQDYSELINLLGICTTLIWFIYPLLKNKFHPSKVLDKKRED